MKFVMIMALVLISFVSLPVMAQEKQPIIFDFSDGNQGWEIPDWAGEQKDMVVKSVETSTQTVLSGKNSLALNVEFPGNVWTAAMVEYKKDMNLVGYKTITTSIFLPKALRVDFIQARFILTAGPWIFIEQKEPAMLKPGKWTKLTALIGVDEMNENLKWKIKDKKEGLLKNLNRVRKIGIRVEYNANAKQAGPKYKGPIYIDTITIE